MTKESEIPVLIVGGGASGVMLSLQLSRYGILARTIDRLDGPSPTSRAITVHSRMLEIFECIDQQLLERFLQRGLKHKGYDLHYVKEGQRSVVRAGIDFTTTDCDYPYLLIHRQDETEKFMREYWTENFSEEVQWSTRLADIKQDDDGVISTVIHTDQNNTVEIIKSKYVIACDGINSQVRRCLKIEQDESNYQGTVLQNLDIRLKNFPDSQDYIHYCAGTDHFMMVAYLPGDYYRLLISDRGEAADSNYSPQQAFQILLDQHFDGVEMGELIWHSKWESWVRLAKNYREKNIFLVGDSAHVHSTTGGQGMNCCIQDAYNLGWKLAMVEKGLAKAELLDSYEDERRPIAEQVIWAASSLHEIFMGHGKDISERTEQMNDPDFLDKVVGCCSGISYTYRDYVEKFPALTTLSGPQPGDRAPNVSFEDGSNLFRLIGDTLYTLLASAKNLETESLLAEIAEQYPDSIKTHLLNNSAAFNQRYGGNDDCRLYLIRPDGYIGFRCLIDEAEELKNYLAQILK